MEAPSVDTGAVLAALNVTGGWLAFVAVVSLLLWLVLSGRLVPRSQLEDQRRDTQLWKTAWHKLFEAKERNVSAAVTSVTAARVSTQFVQAGLETLQQLSPVEAPAGEIEGT